MSDTAQIQIVVGIALTLFVIGAAATVVGRWIRVYGPWSARFANTNASTNLSKKVKGVMKAGDTVWVPGGRGRYPFTLGVSGRASWEAQVAHWLTLGVSITYFLNSPTAETEQYWQRLLERLPTGLRVLILDRALASPADQVEIDRLERFHPVLAIRGERPLCMWVENDHPPESCVAYNVEYVAPPDMSEFQIARFNRYRRVITELTNENKKPAHLRELRRSSPSSVDAAHAA